MRTQVSQFPGRELPDEQKNAGAPILPAGCFPPKSHFCREMPITSNQSQSLIADMRRVENTRRTRIGQPVAPTPGGVGGALPSPSEFVIISVHYFCHFHIIFKCLKYISTLLGEGRDTSQSHHSAGDSRHPEEDYGRKEEP